MNVIGPAWPSTEALRQALAEVPPADFTLRWGNRTHNGWEQLQAFAEAGVPCPLATNSLVEAQEYVRSGKGSLWGRALNHTQGTDIVGAGYRRHAALFAPAYAERWNRRWVERDFWVEPIATVDEYRQHIWDGKCIRVGKKVQTGPTTRALPVRSRRNGWTIDYGARVEDAALREKIRAAARGACAALGYTGGAVDLVVDRAGEVYVLEVNSAPALRDENTLAAYVQAITEWAGRGLPE